MSLTLSNTRIHNIIEHLTPLEFFRILPLGNTRYQPNYIERQQMSTSSHVVTLRLNTEIYSVIRSTAEKEDIPASFVIRRALKKGLGITQSTTSAHNANTSAATPTDAKADEIVESWEWCENEE